MTVEQAKAKLLAWVSAQIGYREGAGNFNKYAAMANVERLYGGSIQNEPWCDVFTDAAFVTVFGLQIGAAMTYQSVGGGSALCRDSAQHFNDHGAFTRTPEPGDVIFFYVGGTINHQGIVLRVVGGSVITVEGNSSDMVAERCYSLSDPSIAGYGRPRWELAAIEEYGKPDSTAGAPDNIDPSVDETGPEMAAPAPIKPEQAESGDNVHDSEKSARYYELRLPYLSRGSYGDDVWAVQVLLQAHNISCGPDGADRDFGVNTERAVREFQRKHGLQADGIVGPDTGAAIFGAEVYTPPTAKAETRDEPKADSFWNNLISKIKN